MKTLISVLLIILLAGCGGGGEEANQVSNVTSVIKTQASIAASPASTSALQVYQALYGKAPSNSQLQSFVTQIGSSNGFAWANSIALSAIDLSDIALSTLVINNISITPTSLNATTLFGTGPQAYVGFRQALAEYFSAVGFENRGTVILQLARIIASFEGETTFGVYGNAATSFNRQISKNLAYSSDPKNMLDGIVQTAVANAGSDQTVLKGALVVVDGSASTVDYGKSPGYRWYLESKPGGSKVTLNSTSAKQSFIADAPGKYVVRLYVNDGRQGGEQPAIVTINAIGPMVSTVAGNGALGLVDGRTTSAQFSNPQGLAVASDGTVFVADTENNVIRKITPAGLVSTLAGSPKGESGLVDGSGSSARFYKPIGIAVDSNGLLYVADSENNVIRKITPAGLVSTIAGSSIGERGFVDGRGLAARFKRPTGIAVDGTGTIVVADTLNYAIRKITSVGAVSTLAGSSLGEPGLVDGTGAEAKFEGPFGISIDNAGGYWVADFNGIRRISSTSVVSTLKFGVDNCMYPDICSGSIYGALRGVSKDKAGNILVSSPVYNAIYSITPSGVVDTFAGYTTSTYSGFFDGNGEALFRRVSGISVEINGNVYVADSGNHAIRKIVP